MTAGRLRVALTALLIAIVVALLLLVRTFDHKAELRQVLDRMDRDVAAAKAASDSAARSAAEAAEAAHKAWQALPGSS